MGQYYTGYNGQEYYDSEMESAPVKPPRAKARFYIRLENGEFIGPFSTRLQSYQYASLAGLNIPIFVSHTELMRQFRGETATIKPVPSLK